MNRLPGEQNGGQANCWGHSVSLTQFLVYIRIKKSFILLVLYQWCSSILEEV